MVNTSLISEFRGYVSSFNFLANAQPLYLYTSVTNYLGSCRSVGVSVTGVFTSICGFSLLISGLLHMVASFVGVLTFGSNVMKPRFSVS